MYFNSFRNENVRKICTVSKSPYNLNEQTLFHFAFYGQTLIIFDLFVSINFQILIEVHFFQLDFNIS